MLTLWSMQCNMKIWQELSSFSRAEENHGKSWSSQSVCAGFLFKDAIPYLTGNTPRLRNNDQSVNAVREINISYSENYMEDANSPCEWNAEYF
jgi:hypothetical protein